jgi:hypothetical protein
LPEVFNWRGKRDDQAETADTLDDPLVEEFYGRTIEAVLKIKG